MGRGMDLEGGDPDWRGGVDGSNVRIARSALLAGLAAALVFASLRYSGILGGLLRDPSLWYLTAAVAVGAGIGLVRRVPAMPAWTAALVLLTVPSSSGGGWEAAWILLTGVLALPAAIRPGPLGADLAAVTLLAGPAAAWSVSSTGPGFGPALLAVGAAMALRAGHRDPATAAAAILALRLAVVSAILSAAVIAG
jgi:hypothetical protein